LRPLLAGDNFASANLNNKNTHEFRSELRRCDAIEQTRLGSCAAAPTVPIKPGDVGRRVTASAAR